MENEACMFHKNCDFERDVGDCPDRCLQFRGNTNFDHLRSLSDEDLAWFINLSPEMEFEICLYCNNGNTVPDDRGICLRPGGRCFADDRCEAFLKWGRSPYKEEQHGT